ITRSQSSDGTKPPRCSLTICAIQSAPSRARRGSIGTRRSLSPGAGATDALDVHADGDSRLILVGVLVAGVLAGESIHLVQRPVIDQARTPREGRVLAWPLVV